MRWRPAPARREPAARVVEIEAAPAGALRRVRRARYGSRGRPGTAGISAGPETTEGSRVFRVETEAGRRGAVEPRARRPRPRIPAPRSAARRGEPRAGVPRAHHRGERRAGSGRPGGANREPGPHDRPARLHRRARLAGGLRAVRRVRLSCSATSSATSSPTSSRRGCG